MEGRRGAEGVRVHPLQFSSSGLYTVPPGAKWEEHVK